MFRYFKGMKTGKRKGRDNEEIDSDIGDDDFDNFLGEDLMQAIGQRAMTISK